MSFFRKNIERLEPYVPGIQPKEYDFIKLNTNENPYPPSPRVSRTLRRVNTDTLRLYPDPHSDRLRDKIGQVYGFHRDNIIVGNGSDELISIILRCFAGEGDRVVFPTPSYSLFPVLAQIQGAEITTVELNEDFSLPELFYTTSGNVTFLASPNSPTGTVYPVENIKRILQHAEGVVLIDEAYVDFAGTSFLPLVREFSQLIVIRTFSKSYGLAGVRIGYGFAHPELIAGMMKVKDCYNLNRLSALIAEEALMDREYFQSNIQTIKKDRDYLRKRLEAMDFYVFPSGANFLLVRPPGIKARKIYERLVDRKILIRYFSAPRLRDYLRIGIGTRKEIELLLRALKEILEN